LLRDLADRLEWEPRQPNAGALEGQCRIFLFAGRMIGKGKAIWLGDMAFRRITIS
jgi:hypothetical protein